MEIPFKNSPSRKSSIYDESLRFQTKFLLKKKKKLLNAKNSFPKSCSKKSLIQTTTRQIFRNQQNPKENSPIQAKFH